MEPIIQFYNSLPDQTKKEEYVRSLMIATEYFEKQYVIPIPTESSEDNGARVMSKKLSTRSK